MVKNFSTYSGDTGDRGLISGSGRSPGGGNGNPPLEEEILAWRIQWSENPGGLQSIGLQRVRPTEQLSMDNQGHQALEENQEENGKKEKKGELTPRETETSNVREP